MTLYNIQSLSPISFLYSINIYTTFLLGQNPPKAPNTTKTRKLQRSKQQQKCSQRFQIKYYILSSPGDPVPRPPPLPEGRPFSLVPWKTQALKTKLLLLI